MPSAAAFEFLTQVTTIFKQGAQRHALMRYALGFPGQLRSSLYFHKIFVWIEFVGICREQDHQPLFVISDSVMIGDSSVIILRQDLHTHVMFAAHLEL